MSCQFLRTLVNYNGEENSRVHTISWRKMLEEIFSTLVVNDRNESTLSLSIEG